MKTPRPTPQELYDALVKRDPSFEGQFYVGVTSTRIFCRMTCPARKPLQIHCRFFSSREDCLREGFRPCKRCSPMAPKAEADHLVQTLLKLLETESDKRWTGEDMVRLGFDPSTVRRKFKRHFGVTFLAMARQRRLQQGFQALSQGVRVIDAQHEAGYDSPAAFRAAFAKLLGQAPGDFSQNSSLRADWLATPLGPMLAVSDRQQLHLLEFLDRRSLATELTRLRKGKGEAISIGRFDPTNQVASELTAYFAGESAVFSVPLACNGSAFARKVWAYLQQIPVGQTRSYREVAQGIGRPDAIRAVARSNGANQIALVIPCHRVIGADGSLTGYGGGLWRKQKLIDLERKLADQKKGVSNDKPN